MRFTSQPLNVDSWTAKTMLLLQRLATVVAKPSQGVKGRQKHSWLVTVTPASPTAVQTHAVASPTGGAGASVETSELGEASPTGDSGASVDASGWLGPLPGELLEQAARKA
jgi:hypothetical protein